jgi:hypothetical protein
MMHNAAEQTAIASQRNIIPVDANDGIRGQQATVPLQGIVREVQEVGLGGWRGWLGLLMIALILGLAYASLLSTVLGQWIGEAGSPIGIAVLAAAGCLSILIWLLGGIRR